MKYDGFISYSHAADLKLAPAIQFGLEKFARPFLRKRALHIFRDETDLSANPHLWETISNNLEQSRWLLLMASPTAAKSKWVAKELDWWLTHRGVDKLLIVLTAGELTWDEPSGDFDWTRTTAIPDVLKSRTRSEPLFVDLRWAQAEAQLTLRHTQFRSAILSISAALRGLPKDELDGIAVRTHRRVIALTWATIAVLCVAVSTAGLKWSEAANQRDIATSRELSVNAALVREQDPELSLLLALDAVRIKSTDEAEVATRNALVDYNGSHLRAVFQGGHQGAVRWATFHPNGAYIATASEDGTAAVWSITGGPPLHRINPGARDKFGNPFIMYQANFNPDGSLIATASADGMLRIYHTDTGLLKCSISVELQSERNSPLRSAFFSHDGRRIVTAAEDHSVIVWDPNDCSKYDVLQQAGSGPGILYSAMFNSNDSPVVTASQDSLIQVLKMQSGNPVKELHSFARTAVRGAVFSPPDDRFLLTVGESDKGLLWDTRNWKVVGEISGHNELLRWAAFSSDRKQLATASGDHKTRGYDVDNILHNIPGPKFEFPNHSASVNSVEFSKNGKFLLTGSSDGTARLWEIVATSHKMTPLEHSSAVRSVTFSTDGKYIATASGDGTFALWEATRGSEMFRSAKVKGWVTSVSFNFDNSLLITVGTDNTARIWSVHDRRMLKELQGRKAWVYSAIFSGDGSLAATSSGDGTAKIWNVADGRNVASCDGESGRLTKVAFVGSGKSSRIVTVGQDGLARFWSWDERIAKLLAQSRQSMDGLMP